MLDDYEVETARIEYGKGRSFEVRGLSFAMVARLVHGGHRADLAMAFEALSNLYEQSQKLRDGAEAGTGNVMEGLGAVLAQLPALCAKVIATAGNDANSWMKVETLPAPVQLEALMAIGRLTFDGEDSVKKFVSGLMSLMSGVTKTVNGMTPQQSIGSTESGSISRSS